MACGDQPSDSVPIDQALRGGKSGAPLRSPVSFQRLLRLISDNALRMHMIIFPHPDVGHLIMMRAFWSYPSHRGSCNGASNSVNPLAGGNGGPMWALLSSTRISHLHKLHFPNHAWGGMCGTSPGFKMVNVISKSFRTCPGYAAESAYVQPCRVPRLLLLLQNNLGLQAQ